MSHKHDDKKENIQKIKEDIKNTQNNIEFTNNMIAAVSEEETKKLLKEQNDQRVESVHSMVKKVKDKVLD